MMRPLLRWILGATSLLSVAALWVGDKPTKIVEALEREGPPVGNGATAVSAIGPNELLPLPGVLDPMQVEGARRDIFMPIEPPAPKTVSAAPVPPPPPPPPPTPTAPALAWRYMGSMVTPEGQRLVMLSSADRSMTVEVGARLEEGYVVEAVGSDAVRLVYPPLGTTIDIPIPPAPAPLR